MRILPFEKFTIESVLSPKQVMATLENQVTAKLPARRGKGKIQEAFHGTLKGHTFKIRQTFSYQTSLVPFMYGTVAREGKHAHIHIHMKLDRLVSFFMVVWTGIAFYLIVQNLRDEALDMLLRLAPVGAFLVGYALMIGGYLYYAAKSKKKLLEVVKGKLLTK